MLQVSDRALAVIEEIRDISGADEGEGIVLFREDDGGVGFAVGTPGEEDQIVSRDGQPVVIVSQELAQPLDGYVLDLVETADGGNFTLVRP